ncbi:GPI-anchored protein [Canna indica]|uniref:GPI-anchored protein n=1 Tax=Canna indica TaxID=4628 RepID=A0AAQ3JN09_9LILI|nr:GPI-anchored protein [Canna indica]
MKPSAIALLVVLLLVSSSAVATGITLQTFFVGRQSLDAGGFDSTTVPAFPVVKGDNQSACHLDLSDELFGGVDEACARGGLDRSRCCPVLAAWLFAAHARYALELRPPPRAVEGTDGADGPMMPDDNQKCVDSLHNALEGRGIRLPRANATCDTILCFCGIRLHQIGSLRCPAAFNVSGGAAAARNATPTAAVRQLERDCLNASYAGCTRCLHSLEKVKESGGGNSNSGSNGTRATRMFGRDCQLMGLTWLLARNRTAYIPTASAVLRAVLYSAHPPQPNAGDTDYKCSPDQENMPLAVDSLQFQQQTDSATTSASGYSSSSSGFALLLSFLVPVLAARLPGL